MFRKTKIVFFLLLSFFLVQCEPEKESVTPKKSLKIAVAANVFTTLEEIKTLFEKETGIFLELISNSSGKLTAQITSGAPFDVFLSADMKYPESLYREGHAVGEPRVYAKGALVLWTCHLALDVPLDVLALDSPQIKKIAMANPEAAPYGRAAVEVLKNTKMDEKIQNKLILGKSISQVNQYISLKSVEVGFTAKSVVLAPNLPEQGVWKEISSELYSPIFQGVVLLKHSQENHSQEAQAFLDFLFSPKATDVFTRYGYLPPEE